MIILYDIECSIYKYNGKLLLIIKRDAIKGRRVYRHYWRKREGEGSQG